MTSKERLQTALNHREPDRVPIDFGGTTVTGLHVSCVAALRDYYGLENRPVKVHEPCQMLGLVEDDLRTAIGADVTGVFGRKTKFGYANEKWKPWRFNGIEVLVGEGFATTVDANGDTLIYPQGDMSVPPSGRMPAGGQFFDAIVRQKPIDEQRLNPEDNLEEYAPIALEDLNHFARSADALRGSGVAVVGCGLGATALGDIANVPGPGLKDPKGIRDVAEWYMSTTSRRAYVQTVFERQCDIAIGNLEKIHDAVGDGFDAVYLCGTDFGTQTSAFCSVRTFRELYFPHYLRLNNWIHQHTAWKSFKHSCGSVERFMEAFIEAGFDIINPVQCSATGMEPEKLKEKYGDRLVFWGGGVDTQQTLPFGTPAMIREQVLRRCEIFSPGGGFVFDAIHNVQAGTPVENIIAMIDAVHEFNGARR